MDPKNSLAYKAWALGGLGKYKEAITYLDKALATHANDKVALTNKGRAFRIL